MTTLNGKKKRLEELEKNLINNGGEVWIHICGTSRSDFESYVEYFREKYKEQIKYTNLMFLFIINKYFHETEEDFEINKKWETQGSR